jgi:hypothetical protein
MTLDLSAIAGQIRAMAAGLDGDLDRGRFDALASAWHDLNSAELSQRLATAKTTFLVPGPECPDFVARSTLPAPFTDYAAVATDGSFILPSRHHPARFWMLNLGTIVLHYGSEPSATLSSHAHFYSDEADLFVPDDLYRIPVSGNVLSPKRAAAELDAAVTVLESLDMPAMALQDGTLILWDLTTLPDAVTAWALPTFLAALGRARDMGKPVASYISAPGSSELLNALRVAICDYPPTFGHVDCDHCRRRIASEGRTPACDILPPVSDQWLLREISELQPGERTAVYKSMSTILNKYDAVDPDFHVYYFYLHNGWEIGRVEIPRWVAEELELLELVHWAVYDQSQLGLGYPAALQEAHELAVLSMSDRRMVEDAVERALADAGLTITYQGKAGSKRVRAI